MSSPRFRRSSASAFDALDVPEDGGRVIFANEESGRAALWRRLDALARGSAIDRDELRQQLFVAANARVRLDDPGWQRELVAMGHELRPSLICFDPLARMKAPARDESAQSDMAAVIEFLRELRDETGAAVAFVHHVGHTGDHMRGSSDLESAWESRLAWKKAEDGLIQLASEHREAEAGPTLRYRISWDGETRTIRFPLETLPSELLNEVRAYLADNLDATANAVVRAPGRERKTTLAAVRQVRSGGSGTTQNHHVGAVSAAGSHDPHTPLRGVGLGTGGLRSGSQVSELATGDDGFLELVVAPAAKAGELTTSELTEITQRHERLREAVPA